MWVRSRELRTAIVLVQWSSAIVFLGQELVMAIVSFFSGILKSDNATHRCANVFSNQGAIALFIKID